MRAAQIERANPDRYLVKVIILFSFLFFVAPVDAQTSRKSKQVSVVNAPCTLTKDKIPPIRGFFLGQKLTEISLAGITDAYEESASKREKPYESVLVSLYDLFPKGEPNLPEFFDASFMLHFFNKQVSAIFIDYQNYEAENVREFIASAATKLGLPTWLEVPRHILCFTEMFRLYRKLVAGTL